jgi:hypothetical protein
MKNDYALSGWIANLGVDPLFSFACFLFEPDFLSFFFLIVRVCVVFEAMSISLCFILLFNYRVIFLSRIASLVKIFLVLMLCSNISYASKKDIFLAKGEQMELSIGKLKNFSVGNKDVIKYKYLPKRGKILIKGQSLGFSDLVVWGKHKEIFHFYVTSKREQLKRMEIAQILKTTQLRTKISGDIIYVDGEVKSLTAYLLLKNVERKKLENLIVNVTIHEDVRNEIISSIYNDFYAAKYDFISCRLIRTNFTCEYKTKGINPQLISKYKKDFLIQFNNLENELNRQNYKLEFKIVSTETNQNKLRDSGLHNIEASLTDLINSKMLNLSSDNIFIEDQDLFVKLLATPIVSTTIKSPFQIQMGGEIPYTSKEDNPKTEWKFAGLKLDGKLDIEDGQIKLKYKSTITKGDQAGVSGPKGHSTVFIPLNKATPLFTVQMSESIRKNESIPGFNKIPFLKDLFSSSNKSMSTKTITVFTILRVM